MSFSHKGFVFDWTAFQAELAPVLHDCLTDSQTERLIFFVNKHRDSLTDPYEGEPLAADWQEDLEARDAHEIGDYALTRYYDPADDSGLGEGWMSIEAALDDEGKRALLGEPFGPDGHEFDPGRMGSYFQTPEMVAKSLETLRRAPKAELNSYLALLEKAREAGKGVYVTF
jgi:hypothetical protein